MIDLQDVTVVYGRGPRSAEQRTALARVSLTIRQGEFAFIIGSTGAGKSTLLKLLYAEEQATSGSVRVLGEDLSTLRARDVPRLRRRMGLVFQDIGLLPDKTLFENVAFALRVTGAGRREIRSKVPAALDLVGLTHRCDALPHQVSGGEQQRIAIARALVNQPPLLIADEPTGNLDPETSRSILNLLLQVNATGTTVLVATHDPLLVDIAEKRVLQMDHGQLIRDDATGRYERALPLVEAPPPSLSLPLEAAAT
jgi:cell division transport system ATP-binding protein